MHTVSSTPHSRKASSRQVRPFAIVDYLWFAGGFVAIFGTIAGLLWIGG